MDPLSSLLPAAQAYGHRIALATSDPRHISAGRLSAPGSCGAGGASAGLLVAAASPGTLKGCLQCGQRAVRPAQSSGTFKTCLQLGHATFIVLPS